MSWVKRYLAARANRKIGREAIKKFEDGEAIDEHSTSQRMVLLTIKAMSEYKAPVVDYDIFVYRASLASLAFLAAGPKLGWQDMTTGQLKVIDKRCDHVTMLSAPVATEIGRELNAIYKI